MSFPRYPTYKDSGVEWLGEVPGHWSVKRLRFVAELNPSKSELNHLNRETAVSFLPMDAIGEDGSLNLEKEKPIHELESGYTYFRDGDVTVAKITPCYENGKGALMQGLLNGVGFGTTELIVARPRPEEITGTYLHYLFISPDFRSIGESHMYGAGGQKRVPDAFVRNFATAFPPVTEQTQITAFLNRETAKIDGLVAEQRRLMALLKEKRQAVISHAVTQGLNPHAPMKPSGVEWLGEVPAHWVVQPLKHVVSLKSGGTPSKANLAYWDGDVPWASSKDLKVEELADTQDHITQQALDEGAAELVAAGSLLIVVRGMILIHTFPVVKTLVPMAINQDLKALTPCQVLNIDFLALLLRGSSRETLGRVDEAAHGTKVLRLEDWTSLPLPIPPIHEQFRIVAEVVRHLAEIDTLTAEAQRAIALLQERRTALISAAVTGQIDVRGLAAVATH